MANKRQITGKTHASAVSKQLRMLGYSPYGVHETRHGGYLCQEWPDIQDINGGRVVKVMYQGAERELTKEDGDKRKTSVREAARLGRMNDMMEDLKTLGYFVVWGWDASGKTDDSFLVVSGAPARRSDVPETQETTETVETPQEAVQAPAEPEKAPVRLHYPALPMLTIDQAEEHVRLIQTTAQADPGAASGMERHLYYLALVAVVGGSDEAVDVAATVLQTQGILLPR